MFVSWPYFTLLKCGKVQLDGMHPFSVDANVRCIWTMHMLYLHYVLQFSEILGFKSCHISEICFYKTRNLHPTGGNSASILKMRLWQAVGVLVL